MEKLEELLEWGGIKRDIVFLILSGLALIASMFDFLPLPFDPAWVAIILCGVPIILEAVIGLVTAFDWYPSRLSHPSSSERILPPGRWPLLCS